MMLSPEEKRRIYEEEKARIEARAQAEKDRKQQQARKSAKGCVVMLLIIAIIAVLITLISGKKTEEKKSSEGVGNARERWIADCVQMRLDPNIVGAYVLPRTYAGVNEADRRCRIDLDTLIQLERLRK